MKSAIKKMLEDSLIRYDWKKVVKILEQTDDNSIYTINFELVEDGTFNLNATRYLKENEIQVKDHEFKKYEENFKGIYRFEIELPFKSLTKEQVDNIRELSNKHTIKVDLNTLINIVDKYNLEIDKEKYYYDFYSKERTNFMGKHSKGIDVFKKNL